MSSELNKNAFIKSIQLLEVSIFNCSLYPRNLRCCLVKQVPGIWELAALGLICTQLWKPWHVYYGALLKHNSKHSVQKENKTHVWVESSLFYLCILNRLSLAKILKSKSGNKHHLDLTSFSKWIKSPVLLGQNLSSWFDCHPNREWVPEACEHTNQSSQKSLSYSPCCPSNWISNTHCKRM